MTMTMSWVTTVVRTIRTRLFTRILATVSLIGGFMLTRVLRFSARFLLRRFLAQGSLLFWARRSSLFLTRYPFLLLCSLFLVRISFLFLLISLNFGLLDALMSLILDMSWPGVLLLILMKFSGSGVLSYRQRLLVNGRTSGLLLRSTKFSSPFFQNLRIFLSCLADYLIILPFAWIEFFLGMTKLGLRSC